MIVLGKVADCVSQAEFNADDINQPYPGVPYCVLDDNLDHHPSIREFEPIDLEVRMA